MLFSEVDEELDLTGIDDDEIDSYIMSPQEIKLKTKLWLKVRLLLLKLLLFVSTVITYIYGVLFIHLSLIRGWGSYVTLFETKTKSKEINSTKIGVVRF